MRLFGARAFELVRNRGICARHQSRKQGDGRKREKIEKLPYAEETENKSCNKSCDDRQQKEQAHFEFSEKVAERIQQFFIQFENDRHRAAAHPRNDHGKPDQKPEDSAFCNLPPVFISEQ